MTYKTFPSTVPSGVGWLGEIPSHWAVVPAKALFSLRAEKALPNDIHLTPSQKFGVLPQVEYMEITGSRVVLNLTESGQMKHVEQNDFVSHLRSFQGGLELSRVRGKVSGAYTVLKPRRDQNPEFWGYALKSATYIQALQTTTDQLRDGQSIRLKEFAQIPLPLVPRAEQDAIVVFLDRELLAIDTLAHKLSELLQKSKELRRSSIFHLATSPESDSSNHSSWQFGKVKHLAKISSGRNFPIGTVLESGDTPVYGGNGVRGFTNDSPDFREARVVIGRVGAHCGNTHVTSPHFSASEHCLVLEPKVKYDSVWLASYLEALNLGSLSQSAAQPLVTGGDIRDLSIRIPPFETQKAIGLKITAKLSEIDHLTAQIENVLALISQRRSALISGAVTGKIISEGN